MKYIVLSVSIGHIAKEVPIIFPDFMVHDMVLSAMVPVLQGHGFESPLIVSAGELKVMVDRCNGGSTSIKPNVSSRGATDYRLINGYDYSHGTI